VRTLGRELPPITDLRTNARPAVGRAFSPPQVQVFEKDMTAIRGEGKYRGPIQVG
jgi:hypothetical protein